MTLRLSNNIVISLQDLLISYNIGIDREVEQSARLKDTANRVGLSMPQLFEEEQSK